jgi:hypothetical protein
MSKEKKKTSETKRASTKNMELRERVQRTRRLGLGSVRVGVADSVNNLQIGPLFVAQARERAKAD